MLSLTLPAIAQNAETQSAETQSAETQNAVTQNAVTWEDLQSYSTQLRNPYEQLTTAQTYQLSNLYQLREWVEANQPEPDSYERKELQRLEDALAAEGIDANELLKEVEAAQAYWAAQSRTTNAEITNRLVSIDGYVLPLGDDQAQQIDEFLLVPYVGACVHVPAPPPNQMVYIKAAEAVENPGIFSPVQVKGKLQAHEGSYELFQVDGSRTVDVSYRMSLEAIAPASNQPISPSQSGGSLLTLDGWKALPAQISGTLTTALNQIQNQKSPQALAFALLLSFSYGVLHTLGPGHGKAVIISYFVGQGGSLQRGLLMGGQIAIFHVLSATLLVIFTDTVVRQIGGGPASNYRVVQLISYGAIALLGAWMVRQTLTPKASLSKARPSKARSSKARPSKARLLNIGFQSKPAQSELAQSEPAQLAETQTDKALDDLLYPSLSQQIQREPIQRELIRRDQQSGRQNEWMACGCVACDGSGRMSNWLAMAVGAVPCSGALLVLLYGLANDMLWQSVAMVIAISVGMAITLAWIGVVAILTHRWGNQMAQRRLARPGAKKSATSAFPFPLAQTVRVLGASCVCLLGLSLFALTWMAGA